jgi:uncharacterized protein
LRPFSNDPVYLNDTTKTGDLKMDAFSALIVQSILQVWTSLTHNWPYLVISVLIAVALKLYLDPKQVGNFLLKYRSAGVIGATAAAVGTPLCSCGTTAVVLGMMASMLPWAPIVAFMVASPLTSPEELIYSAGLFGWPFALAFFISSIVLGLLGGYAASVFESKGWLANQTRFSEKAARQPAAEVCACSATADRPESVAALAGEGACSCGTTAKADLQMVEASCGCGSSEILREPAPVLALAMDAGFAGGGSAACSCGTSMGTEAVRAKPAAVKSRVSLQMFLAETLATGKRLLLMFLGFAFIGYFLNGLIPAEWIALVFGQGNVYSVPLAATLGLPLYVNSEASLPLVRALIDGGMSQGAALAFLITGAGTSVGAIAGALTIARWRVIGLVVGTLWLGAVVMGVGYNLLLAAHVF